MFGWMESAGGRSHGSSGSTYHRTSQPVAPSTMTLRRQNQKKPGFIVPNSSATASATTGSCDSSAALALMVAGRDPVGSGGRTTRAGMGSERGVESEADKGPGTGDSRSCTRHTALEDGSSSELKGRRLNEEQQLYATQQLQSHQQVDTSSHPQSQSQARLIVSGSSAPAARAPGSTSTERRLPKIILKVKAPT